jgi:hypothetical protein
MRWIYLVISLALFLWATKFFLRDKELDADALSIIPYKGNELIYFGTGDSVLNSLELFGYEDVTTTGKVIFNVKKRIYYARLVNYGYSYRDIQHPFLYLYSINDSNEIGLSLFFNEQSFVYEGNVAAEKVVLVDSVYDDVRMLKNRVNNDVDCLYWSLRNGIVGYRYKEVYVKRMNINK